MLTFHHLFGTVCDVGLIFAVLLGGSMALDE
jgi:hypothetical protein